MSICSLQTYDKASASKLSNYPVRNQSFLHSPFLYAVHRKWSKKAYPEKLSTTHKALFSLYYI